MKEEENMTIDANTKIGSIIKRHSSALEAIISISTKFEKLRNPLLRKVMAPRTTLAAASKLGNCSVEDFYQKLEPLGFIVNREIQPAESAKKQVPAFISELRKDQISELDVRTVISSGTDPLKIILEKIKPIAPGNVLKIINSFEPTPLITMLEKKGFETYVDEINPDLFETYFLKKQMAFVSVEAPQQSGTKSWEHSIKKWSDKLVKIDVRNLEMPAPMHTILEALESLPEENALYVFHKRIPVFLLPELAERGFDYRIHEVKDGEVHLLIFKA